MRVETPHNRAGLAKDVVLRLLTCENRPDAKDRVKYEITGTTGISSGSTFTRMWCCYASGAMAGIIEVIGGEDEHSKG